MFKFLEDYKKKRSQLKSLVALTRLEGITYEDYQYLLRIGANVNVSKEDIETMLKRTKNIKVSKPSDIIGKIDYIYDIVVMALADGVLDEDDIENSISVSEKLGLPKKTVGVLVRMIFLLVDEKKTKIEVIEKLIQDTCYDEIKQNKLDVVGYPKIEIVTIKELLNDKRLNLPQAVEVLKEAQIKKAIKNISA